ncbi:MAG: flagellar motor protein MotB, partial [Campylobacterales bacterium]
MATFGDLMSLLLTFFVLLLSMATFETKKVAEAIGSLEGALGVLEEGKHSEPVPPNPIKATPIETDSDSPTAINA